MNATTQDLVFHRCGCVDAETGRQFGARCPNLCEESHGSWYFAIQVTTVGGYRARHRHGGYPTRAAAAAARSDMLALPAQLAAGQAWTVGRWLRHWLDTTDGQLRPSTVNSYHCHVDRYLVPTLGRLTLGELSTRKIQECVNHLARQRRADGSRLSASTVDRVRATLRAALNAAVRGDLLPANPVRGVRITKPTRPHPVAWTDEVVQAWRRTGMRPPVAVWTLPQLITFLDGVREDRLAALWWLIALRGLRRGEAVGLQRSDLDIAHQELYIHHQLVALPGQLYAGPPKSRHSNRTIALDTQSTQWLAGQQARQEQERREHRYVDQRRRDSRLRTGNTWDDTEALFTYTDGRPVRPEYLTHRFNAIVKQLELPPVRMHDLRHGAATLALAAHTDLKIIQHMLGHASIVTTADTYTSVLPEVAHLAAQAVADLILSAARQIPGAKLDEGVTQIPTANTEAGFCQT
ncbi:tyrosine-type recombinase/integrase [Catellatospora bangladeshensis]|uniref:Site-specific integrase n=1 Tax=Catellatospora bangladeshensis TaxID=310355 RepID=A0A8J3JDX3_9ACTN|nr:tyrosine-type recombinase/integrase [Catellatospora bangladeshensis]GIF83147.1 site-specific integrase [Catellatospora bangladeshensis]